MSITTSLNSVLLSSSELASITSQVYPGDVPIDGTYPAVVFRLESDEPTLVLTGEGSMTLATFAIECWDHNLMVAESMASAIKDLLVPWYGAFGSHTVTNSAKTRELHLGEAETKLRRVSLQFQLLYGD